MRDIARLVLVLTLIAATSGLLLSLVESVTREPIAEQRRKETLRALGSVLPPFDNRPDEEKIELPPTYFPARLKGKLAGFAFEVVAPDGYSGDIRIMVGIDPEGRVQGIEILSHAETPGLGNKIEESSFKAQFGGKGLKDADWRVKKDGGDFDQITGATVSPRALVGAVRAGLESYKENRGEILKKVGVRK